MQNEQRMIDANALDAKLDELMTRYSAQGRKAVADDYNFVRTVLLTAPTVDAVEVVHGRNKTTLHPVDEFICSVCGYVCQDTHKYVYDEDGEYWSCYEFEFNYCPNCGAKMDGDGNG